MVLHYWDHLQRALHSSKVLAEELHLVVLVWQFHFADAVYPEASKMDFVLIQRQQAKAKASQSLKLKQVKA